jgi:hypothetical protein
MQIPYQIHDSQIISPISWVILSLSWLCPLKYKSFQVWCSLIYLFFLTAHDFSVIAKNPSPNPRAGRFTLMFSQVSFVILDHAFRSVTHWVDFCIWCELKTHTRSLAYDYPVVWASFSEKTTLPPLSGHGTFFENKLIANTWIYLWTPSSIALIMSVLGRPLHGLGYGRFVVRLNLEHISPLTVLFFFMIILTGNPCTFLWI